MNFLFVTELFLTNIYFCFSYAIKCWAFDLNDEIKHYMYTVHCFDSSTVDPPLLLERICQYLQTCVWVCQVMEHTGTFYEVKFTWKIFPKTWNEMNNLPRLIWGMFSIIACSHLMLFNPLYLALILAISMEVLLKSK